MSAFLIAALGAITALFLTLIEPTPRHLRALKLGAAAALVSVLAAWLWPTMLMKALMGVLVLVLLWGLLEFLGWPVRILGELLAQPTRTDR